MFDWLERNNGAELIEGIKESMSDISLLETFSVEDAGQRLMFIDGCDPLPVDE